MNTSPGKYLSNSNKILEANNVKIVLASKKKNKQKTLEFLFLNNEMMLLELNKKAANTIKYCMFSIYIHLLMHMPQDHIALCIWRSH